MLRIDDRLILKLFGPTQKKAFHVEQAVLQTLAHQARFAAPRLARRCFTTFFYTFSMELLWPYVIDRPFMSADPICEATARLFPPEVFGLAD